MYNKNISYIPGNPKPQYTLHVTHIASIYIQFQFNLSMFNNYNTFPIKNPFTMEYELEPATVYCLCNDLFGTNRMNAFNAGIHHLLNYFSL